MKNQQGVTIFISILILASILVLALAVSDLVLRTSRSAKKIGLSEVAYYAAETAIEKALYQIEKQKDLTGLDGENGSLEDINDATWSRTVSEVASLAIDCQEDLGDNEGICVDDVGEIGPDNPLIIKLNAGNSFQLDLDFTGLVLPNNLQVTMGGSGKVIAFGVDGQQIHIFPPPVVELNDLIVNKYTLRIVNTDSSLATFDIKPSGGSTEPLPLGLTITATGSYKDQQRVIEVQRTNWQIY